MRPLAVVVVDVNAEHAFELTAAEDQQPVQTLGRTENRTDSPQSVVKAAVSITHDPRRPSAGWRSSPPAGSHRTARTSPSGPSLVAFPTNRNNRSHVELYVRSSLLRLTRAREYHVSSSDVNPADCRAGLVDGTKQHVEERRARYGRPAGG